MYPVSLRKLETKRSRCVSKSTVVVVVVVVLCVCVCCFYYYSYIYIYLTTTANTIYNKKKDRKIKVRSDVTSILRCQSYCP